VKTVELRFIQGKLPSPSTILSTAADLIDEHGWKGRGAEPGALDAIGAMRLATAVPIGLVGPATMLEVAAGAIDVHPHHAVFDRFDEAVHLLADRLGIRADKTDEWSTVGALVWRWQGNLDRTAAEVVSVLREAAEAGDPR